MFLKLTSARTNSQIHLNIDHISAIDTASRGIGDKKEPVTMIWMFGGTLHEVKEPIEYVTTYLPMATPR